MLLRAMSLYLFLSVVNLQTASAMSCKNIFSDSSHILNGIVGFKKIDDVTFGRSLTRLGLRGSLIAVIKKVPRVQNQSANDSLFELIQVDDLLSGSELSKNENFKRILIIAFEGNFDVDKLSAATPVSVVDKDTADIRRELLLETISQLLGKVDAIEYSWRSDLYSWRNIEEIAANSQTFLNTGRISVRDLDNTIVGQDLKSVGFYAKTILINDFYRLEPNKRRQVHRLVESHRDLLRSFLEVSAIFELDPFTVVK